MSAKRSFVIVLERGQSQRRDFWEFTARTEEKTGVKQMSFEWLGGDWGKAAGSKSQLKRCLDFWRREGVIDQAAHQDGLSQIGWDPAKDRLKPKHRRSSARRRPR